MDKAGGIIALIAGVLGIVAGFFTLFVGGIGSAFEAQEADSILNLAWVGIAAAMLVVIGGGVSLARPRGGGMAVVFVSVVGIVYGGSLVAICLALALIGGSLAVLAPPKTGESEAAEPARKRWQALAMSLGAGITVLVIATVIEQNGNITGRANAQTANPQHSSNAYPIGQTASGERFAVTLHSFALRDVVGYGSIRHQAPSGTVFAVLEVSVKCIDNESRWYAPGDLIASLDGQTLKFDKHENLFDVTQSFGQINPLTEQKGLIVFSLPVEVANAELLWQPGRGAGETPFKLNVPAVASLPAHPAPAAQASTGTESYRLGGSRLEFAPQPDSALSFKLLIVSDDGNTGEAEGLLQPREGVAVWKNEDFECELTFRWQGNSVELDQKGGCGFGMGVDGSGVYLR